MSLVILKVIKVIAQPIATLNEATQDPRLVLVIGAGIHSVSTRPAPPSHLS